MKLLASLTLLLSWSRLCTASLRETPSLRWTYTLDGAGQGLSGRTLRQGNAVVAWKGGDKIFVTADDASLHVVDVDSSGVTEASVFEPETLDNTFPECRSGVAVVEATNTVGKTFTYLVYSVIDTPLATTVQFNEDEGVLEGDDNADQVTSRVLAVNMDGSLRWSVSVEGQIVGTPVVGNNGDLIYISRNIERGTQGFLSVIWTSEDHDSAELTASIAPLDREAPLGPPSLSQSEDTGNGPDTEQESDLVAVAEMWDDGYTEDGSVYVLVPSPEFEEMGGRGLESYELRLVSRSRWTYSAVMPPLFVGSSMWLGGTGSNLAGWQGNRDLSNVLSGREDDVNPRWSTTLDPNDRNASQPLLTSPVLSSDGSLLYIAGASNNFYCLESDAGRESWTQSVRSAILSQPKTFDDDGNTVVYFIESMDGSVRQFDEGGSELWSFNCADVSGADSCEDGVEAEFSVTDSGNVLYYGDIYGRIVALEVGEFDTEPPTAAPSLMPSGTPSFAPSISQAPTVEPTPGPTTAPTLAPSPADTTGGAPTINQGPGPTNALDDGGNESDDNMGMVIGVAVAGLFLVTLLALYVVRNVMNPSEDNKKSRGLVAVDKDQSENMEEGDCEGGLVDKITITTDPDSVEVGVDAPGTTASTPNKRKKKKKAATPPTPLTLASIEECEEGHGEDDDTAVVLLEDDDPGATPENLMEKFQYVAEAQTFEEDDEGADQNEGDNSDQWSFEDGMAGTSKGGSPGESVAGNEQSRPAEVIATKTPSPSRPEDSTEERERKKTTKVAQSNDDDSVSSDDSDTPPPPPPMSAKIPSIEAHESEEEKKDGEDTDHSQFSPQPSYAASIGAASAEAPSSVLSHSTAKTPTERQREAEIDAVSPGVLSTDSSIYTSEAAGATAASQLSPLSPHVLSKTLDESHAPDDEVSAPDNAVGLMLQPSLDHSYDRNKSLFEDGDAPDDEMMHAPGSHYMLKPPTPNRPKFKPSNGADSPAVRSVRTKRDLTGYSPARTGSSSDRMADSRKPPTFKRRNKREDQAPVATEEDTWSSFLEDLAAAEKQFFSPTEAQSSAVLRYDSDSESTEDM